MKATDGKLGKNIKISARLLRRVLIEFAAMTSEYGDTPPIADGP